MLARSLRKFLAAAEAGKDVSQFRARVDLWVGRYDDVTNQAITFYAERGQRLMWVEGDTVQKCDICTALDGIVAFAWEWEELQVHPQQPPNPALSPENGGCGGWRCGCSLVPTDKRRSPDAFTTIMNIVTR